MSAIQISLVMATYGRKDEVSEFLESVATQQLSSTCFEIIVVDQNDRIDLGPLLENFRPKLEIVHIRLSTKGTSHARNIGLSVARGDFVAFPDDDCQYYPDTLIQALQCSADNPDVDIFHGKIFDRESRRNIMRPWPDTSQYINIYNGYFYGSAIALFAKRHDGNIFDTQFGPGTQYGGYEDVEFVLRNIRAGRKVLYWPAIQVLHPELNRHVMSVDKVFSYGLGFGAMCRKHISIPIFYLFCKSLGFHLYNVAKATFCFDHTGLRSGNAAVISRIEGFLKYGRTGAKS